MMAKGKAMNMPKSSGNLPRETPVVGQKVAQNVTPAGFRPGSR